MNNDLNKVSMRKCEYSSSRIALDTDGQEWIEFIFYLYYSDEYCSRQIRAFSINSVTPNKWKFRDTLIRLSQLFSRNKCLYEIITVGTWEDRNIETSKVLDIDTYTFFEGGQYIDYPEEKLGNIVFIIKRPQNKKILEGIRADFLYKYYQSYKKNLDEKSQMNYEIYSVFENFYKINGRQFEISRNEMICKKKVAFIDTIILLFFSGFIRIISMGLSESIMDEENIEYWEYAKDGERILDYLFTVRLTDAFTKILDTSLVQNELLMESIFNEKYKKITVLKKNGKPYLLERNIEKGEHSTFVELQKKYPHSEIKAKNYNGKTTKYEVKEKIKLDQNGPK